MLKRFLSLFLLLLISVTAFAGNKLQFTEDSADDAEFLSPDAAFSLVLAAQDDHTPVSYTHLDVYKRQLVSHRGKAQIFRDVAVALEDMRHSVAVSYTHLDVYKRQLPGYR